MPTYRLRNRGTERAMGSGRGWSTTCPTGSSEAPGPQAQDCRALTEAYTWQAPAEGLGCTQSTRARRG